MFALSIVSLIGALASSALSSYQQVQMGEQVEENARAEAQRLELEAEEERAARSEERKQEVKAADHRLASITARTVKSGLLMTGSMTAMSVEEAAASAYNIAAKDRASDIFVADRNRMAQVTLMEGESAKGASRYGAFTTVLGGISDAVGIGASYGLSVGKKTKAPDGFKKDGAPSGALLANSMLSGGKE